MEMLKIKSMGKKKEEEKDKRPSTLRILDMLMENVPDGDKDEGTSDEDEGLGVSPEDVQDKSKFPKKKSL